MKPNNWNGKNNIANFFTSPDYTGDVISLSSLRIDVLMDARMTSFSIILIIAVYEISYYIFLISI